MGITEYSIVAMLYLAIAYPRKIILDKAISMRYNRLHKVKKGYKNGNRI